MMHHQEDAPARRVLIVDDCRDSARSLRVLLKMQGYEARIAHDGPEGLRAAKEQRPDIVLLDVTLPGMSGVEVAEAMRQDPALETACIIAVSGHGREYLPDPSPFDHHVLKPIDHDRLFRLLEERCNDRQPPINAVA